MTRENVLIALGVVVALSPYLGLPLSILNVLLPLLGLGIGIIGWTLGRRTRAPRLAPPTYDTPEV